MKIVVQRVVEAAVSVDDRITGKISKGLLVLLGIHKEDNEEKVKRLVHKLIHLRIFSDEMDKMNLSVSDIKGSILVVSQFTLYGNCNSGRRPDFVESANSDVAKQLYEKFIAALKNEGIHVETGEFGAYMNVQLINDGPVTFIIEN